MKQNIGIKGSFLISGAPVEDENVIFTVKKNPFCFAIKSMQNPLSDHNLNLSV
jgi:hypothetical protein